MNKNQDRAPQPNGVSAPQGQDRAPKAHEAGEGDPFVALESLGKTAHRIADERNELLRALRALSEHCDGMESQHSDYHDLGEGGIPRRSGPLNDAFALLERLA